MKKLILAIILAVLAMVALSSCEITFNPHTCEGMEVVSLEPTCDEDGEMLIVCISCYEIMDRQTIPTTGKHTYGERVDAEGEYENCTDRPYTQTCTKCGYTVTMPGDVYSHKFTTETIPSTCSTQGYNLNTCTVCGFVLKDRFQPTSAHTYEKTEVIAPTCTEEGYTIYTCRDCGNRKLNNYTSKAPHEYGNDYESDETYHWSFCLVCSEPSEKAQHTEGDNESCSTCGIKLEFTPGLTYRLSDDGTYAILSRYVGESETVRVAEEYMGVPVTHIGNSSFFGNAKKVIFTENVTHIEDSAFYCSAVHTIENMDNVVYIGKGAFRTCYYLTLTELPQKLEYIGEDAFSSCSRLGISYIPDSVTYIGEGAFSGCNNLGDITIGNGVECIREYTFSHCINLGKVVMGESVVTISEGAFEMSEIKEIVLSDATVVIGKMAFGNCTMLENVHLGKGVRLIEDRAFSGCKELKNIILSPENENYRLQNGVLYNKDITTLVLYPVADERTEFTIPDGVVTIAMSTFSNARLSKVVISDSVKTLSDYAFSNCYNLTSVTMGKGVTDIGVGAFSSCYTLSEITLPNGLASIGSSAFHNTAITHITIPGSVHTIGSGAFWNCSSLTSVTLCEGIVVIDVEAFHWTPIKEIVIPDSVEMIERRAFWGCQELTTIVIGKGVKVIETSAFDGCYNSDIYYRGSEADWKNVTISNRDFTTLDTSRLYFYSESKPQSEGNFWHYGEGGKPAKWE